MGRILDLWFRPKWFESEKLYKKLGVRTFKKFIPTYGDLVLRWMQRHGYSALVRPGDLKSLERYESATRSYEATHVLFFLAYSVIMLFDISLGAWNTFFYMLIANILINIYPVLVQRYNRLRIYNAIRKMKQRPTSLAP